MAVVASDSTPANDYCRDWDITKLKKDVMILNYTDGGLVQKEFVKM
jgi:hypothetical protein